nr:hypothetical protein [Anaerobutyricum hallii]
MRIVDLLKKEAVVLNAEVSTKEQMLDLLVDLHKEVGNIKDKAAFKAGIMKRESEDLLQLQRESVFHIQKMKQLSTQVLQQSQYHLELTVKHLTESHPIFSL